VSIHVHYIEHSVQSTLLLRTIWLSDLLYGFCLSLEISCMAQECSLRIPEDFVLPLLPTEELKDKYRRYLFRDYVEVPYLLSANFGDYFHVKMS